ncbi:MAG: histidinol dehydrogenase [Candidatus Aminicenantes bacterium]
MRKTKINQWEPEVFDQLEFKNMRDVQEIIKEVRKKKDEALKKFTLHYDHVKIDRFKVEKDEIRSAWSMVSQGLILCMEKAARNLRKFSEKQRETFRDFDFEIEPGVLVGQKAIPVKRVGIYVPGGRYPLISSLIMASIPARVAGVEQIMVCSPPSPGGKIHPAILAAARICEVDEIYKVGGVQAIAAMAYGTQSIRRVDKIVGPGNKYVNAAKRIVYGQVGIDFIAGPTELLIIADKDANPSFLAADLIAQAEHDVNAVPMMATDSDELASAVQDEIKKQLCPLKTAEVARKSLQKNGILLILNSMDEAVEFANRRAPEHLQLSLNDAHSFLHRFKNYGSLFIGEYSPEGLGDYISGLNHILPTNYASRYTGGLGVRNFIKTQTLLKVNKKGLLKIGPAAGSMAEAEGLEGHAHSIRIRMKRFCP